MARQFSPQERLGDFLLNKEASPIAVETLRSFLCNNYDPTYRKKIINAQLPRFYNRTSVHLAAEKGLTPFLRILLKHGGNPNVESALPDLKQTPLHLAAKGGYWQCMELLLEYGAKLNVEDMQRRTPRDHIRGRPKCTLVVTHHIAKFTIPQRSQSDEDKVQSLHTMMADDDSNELFREAYTRLNSHQQDLATRWLDMGNNTLLYRACYYNQEEVVKLMLRLSEHTPLTNLNRGDTPLHCACNNDNIRLVEMLLDHSPRLALMCDGIMDKRYSPLHIVCMENGNKRIVEIILQNISRLLETDEYSEDSPLDMNVRDADGCTPLYYACYHGHDEIVTLLLKFGQQQKNCRPFDVTIITLQQRTPLHAAVQKNHLSTLQIILDHCTTHKNNCIVELINRVGRPSSDTKYHLLNYSSCSSSSSIASIASIMSQDIREVTGEMFSPIPEEDETQEQLSPKIPTGVFHPSKSKHGSNKIVTLPNRTLTQSVKSGSDLTVSQLQQTPFKRQRTKTDYSESPQGQMSLFLTKDGSFFAHPTGHHMDNIDKDFDQLLITPLAEACACGHSQAVDMLLSAGASDTEGMAVRLAQFAKNQELARTVLCHHCKLIVENHSSHTLSIDWSGMKITELAGSWFVEKSIFFPTSAEDDEGKDLSMTSSLPGMTSPLPRQLNALKLTNLSLNDNNLSLLPVKLLQLPNLKYLDLSFNRIQNIPSKISCPTLKCLYLGNNKLIELPVTIWYLPYLEELDIKNNILESVGKDTTDHSRLSQSLKMVDISHNKLDELPSFILHLPALESLSVSHNELTTLPHNIWECSTLRELYVSYNALVALPSCEPQSTLMSSQQPHAIHAVQCGQRVVGAKVHVRGNFDRLRSKVYKRNTVRFVNALETPQEVYSEEYISHNEGCCGVEKLYLNGNKLSAFPDALPCLAPLLIELDISRNKIEEIDMSFLPPMLRKLVATNNKITKFGTFVSSQLKSHMIRHCRMVGNQPQQCHHRTHKEMKNLTTINLISNQLKHFQLMQSLELDKDSVSKEAEGRRHSSQLDLLYPELENLNISHNCLQGCFNHNIGCQSQLKSITLSDNVELEELPMEFAYFKKSKKFTQLCLHNLPRLRDPPPEYHNNKLRPLLSYMSSRLKNSVEYRFIKLIVVGCGERGKTTLLRRLRGLPYDNLDRTVGIDIEQWTYGQPPITFITWDFAGQDIYNTTHQCFYSQRSLYLALYRLSDENGVAELDSWLRNIKLRAPGSPVVVIGTHRDKVTDAVVKEREGEVWHQYSNVKLYPTIVDVCSISCVKKSIFFRSSIDRLRTTIFGIATHLRVSAHDGLKLTYDENMSLTDPEALFQQKIPQVYLELQQNIRSAVVTMKTNEKPPVMRSDEFRDNFLSIMDDEEELSDAVEYLHHQGTLLNFTDQALKNVYFLDPQWLCKLMASVIRVPPAGKESIVKNGSVDIRDLFTESKDLQAFKDECINLLSKFDIALRLKNRHLLVPSLLPVDQPSSLPPCTNDSNQLLNGTCYDDSEDIVYPPLWKFWFSKFIPNGFWPRLICRLTTNQSINTILKSAFPVLLDDCGPHSSKDDMFLPWTLWRSGLALTCKNVLLLEVKEVLNNSVLNESMEASVKEASVKDCQFRVEACVNIPGWVTITKQLSSHDDATDQDIAGRATSIMVEIVKHVSSLATDWFPGIFTGYYVEGQVPCYVPCWKCCYQGGDDAKGHEPCLEQGMTAFCIERDGHTVYCWEFDNIIIPAIKGKTIWCDLHCSIDPQQLTPELFFRDLGDYSSNDRQPLWIDKQKVLGKGGFGVVLKGELGNQGDKTPVAIKLLLPEADRKLQKSTLQQVLQSASADHLIPQSYHDVRQEVSILSRLRHDNLAKLCGVRTTPIIPGTTPMICLMLELASKSSLRDVLKKYRGAKLLLEPVTLKTTICQIASGLNYLHQHEIAHLDIKSPNVLVWEFPLQLYSRPDRLEHAQEVLVKIADYGTSRISTLHGIKANNPTGTPGYMAPELFSHQGQEISPDKVDVFAFGMTIYELLTMRPPYDELPRKEPHILHKYVRDGRRPLLTDKEAQSPVLIQEMMQKCWEHEPNNRPSMSQVLQWAESIEFESLRVDSNLAQVTAISTACVSRIDPEFDSYLEYNSDASSYEFLASHHLLQDSLTNSTAASNLSVERAVSMIQPRTGQDGMGEVYRRLGSVSQVHLLAQDSSHVTISACTQTWLCGRDKRKGLVAIFTYEDNKPGYSLFYGYACEQEITAICAVYNYMWLGSVDGELRVIHAPTMKTKFVHSLNSKHYPTPSCILDIIHVKTDRKVMVSTHNFDFWIFSDIPDEGGLRVQSHFQFSDEYPVFHMTVINVNGSPEVWGTRSENKIMVFQRHQSKWDYSELQCAPFSGGRLLTVALATSSVFTGKHGDTKSHVWVSFNRRAYITCWDAVKKKQLHVVDCKKDMQTDEQGLQVSALLASSRFVYVGTTVGVIGVWSSEDATILQSFHYHEHKVRMLLEMPQQVSPCVCPEVPFPEDIIDDDIDNNINSATPLITSIGNGRKKLLLRPNTGPRRSMKHLQRHEDDICLLTWQSWKQ